MKKPKARPVFSRRVWMAVSCAGRIIAVSGTRARLLGKLMYVAATDRIIPVEVREIRTQTRRKK